MCDSSSGTEILGYHMRLHATLIFFSAKGVGKPRLANWTAELSPYWKIIEYL